MMIKIRLTTLLIALSMIAGAASTITAQDTSNPQSQTAQPTEEEQQKAKEALEKRAVALLDQVVDQSQMLRLPENRIRVQITAADLLWQRSEARARSLFSLAADGVAEMMRNTDGNMRRWSAQLRQELVMTAAQHDAPLAYQLLAATRQLTPTTETGDARRPNPDANIEQNLLAQVAALDPKLALQKAEEFLAKGQYPNTLAQVLRELQRKDKEAAAKLSENVLKHLQSENLLTNLEAGSLALLLVQPGPRPAGTGADGSQAVANQAPANPAASNQVARRNVAAAVLSESAFKDLMNTLIDSALRAAPQPANSQRGPNNPRGRGNAGGPQNNNQSPPTDGQVEQANARRLLAGLQGLLPQIDQYLPARAAAVRQKMTEVGMGNDPRMAANQLNSLMRQGTTDSLLAAAPAAPPQLQSRLYRQAALKALDEGNADRARQIANDHLDAATRDAVLQRVDFQVMAKKVEADKMDDLRQMLSSLRSDDERIELLLQLAAATQKNDPKLAARLLGEAQRLTNRRAMTYPQFDQQLRVAQAFATVEPARSFEVLDPGIAQLNELLSAAALLSGFEVNIFKDGELPLQGGSDLGNMVAQYGQELATLAKIDFERAQTAANKFQLAEPRILVQLSIVRNVLGVPQIAPINNGPGGGGFGRRAQ
jgi:hypothetical protein